MNGWMLLWKIVLIGGISLFGCMSVWVTIWGAVDIKKMLESINEEHETGASAPESD